MDRFTEIPCFMACADSVLPTFKSLPKSICKSLNVITSSFSVTASVLHATIANARGASVAALKALDAKIEITRFFKAVNLVCK